MRRLLILALCARVLYAAPAPAPIAYTISFPDPGSKTFRVEMIVPSAGRATVDLMMPVWSPGFYGVQDYAARVSAFTARGADGAALDVQKPSDNRWTVTTASNTSFTATYTVAAPRGSNLGNGVTDTSAVIVGPATYVTLAGETGAHRPADVTLDLPAAWKGSMTSLDAAPDGQANHYVAPDYDVLVDSPILAGAELTTTEFTVAGVKHSWTYLGHAEWDADKAVAMLTPLVEEHVRFWRGLPYKKYAFLNIVTSGGGGSGVEHLNSVAITTNGK